MKNIRKFLLYTGFTIILSNVTALYAEDSIELSPDADVFFGRIGANGEIVVKEYSINTESNDLWLNDLYRFIDDLNQDDVNFNINKKTKTLESDDLLNPTGYFDNEDIMKLIRYCRGNMSFDACASLAGSALDVRNFEWTWENYTLNFSKDGNNTLIALDNTTGESHVLNVTLDTSHGERPTHVVKVTCLNTSSINCGHQALSSYMPVKITNANGDHLVYANFSVKFHIRGSNYMTGVTGTRVCVHLPGNKWFDKSCGTTFVRK